MATADTLNAGATKAGNGRFVFELARLERIAAGPGYSTAEGPVIEGERMQVGLISMPRGTGSQPHSHPNEQWIYLLKGNARVVIGDQPETLARPGTLIYVPAGVVHSFVATPDEDVQFFTVKDMSHGIAGTLAGGTA
ncbi:MAG TPA: cupin domain-containing protein [Burkholderiales bacterium]|nr:cupin domain-containing protein [Burkholderiales bacterium]